MRSADCLGPGGGRADVGIGPYEAEPSNTRAVPPVGLNHKA